MESCCRVCSRSDEFRRFSLYAVAEVSQEVIANMIRDTSDTQVSSEDGLPQHICPDCLMTLSLAYSFRKQCRRSDAKFREYWGGRTPSQSIDQQQQQQQLPRRSQSQAPDDSSFTAIKEEVDIYDYEYSVPSHHDQQQWVIQNPRTIGEGAMTVVHNSGQYYEDAAAAVAGPAHDGAADRDGSSAMPMVTTHLGGGSHHDASEMGESSGLAQKGEKLKKKAPTPERYSQRIRRQPTRKYRNTYTQAQLDAAVFKVRTREMSLGTAAKVFGIPRSTVQTRVELLTKPRKRPDGKVITRPVRRNRHPYSEEQLEAAVLKVRNHEMGLTRAAKFFGIPVSTVQSRLEKKKMTMKRRDQTVAIVPVAVPVSLAKVDPLEDIGRHFLAGSSDVSVPVPVTKVEPLEDTEKHFLAGSSQD